MFWRKQREEVRRRVGSIIHPDRRVADDGKRLDSLSPRWTLHVPLFFLSRGGVRGGVVAGLGLIGGLADDGKRF